MLAPTVMPGIASLQANANATFTATITAISEPREVTTSRGTSKVADATLQDETGTTTLTLWGEDITKYKTGQKLQITDAWVKDFNTAATAVHKLKPPNPVVADAQFLIEQSIQSYIQTAGFWNIAGQLRLQANGERDKKKNKALNDKVGTILLQADSLRRQHGDLLYQRGATELTNLNIEYGLQKPQPQSTPTQ